jgi:hypothetical protein
MRTKRAFLVVAAIALVMGAVPALAQQPSAPPQSSTAQGQLERVDTTAKTITIRTAADVQMVFSYSDTTKVMGAGDSVAGLATLEGTDVTVTYIKRGQENIASQIEVQKKPAA